MGSIFNGKTKGLRKLTQEGSWVVAGYAITILGSLVGVRIITELVSPSAYGEVSLGMTLAALSNQLVFGPLANGVTRFYSAAEQKNDLKGYFLAARTLTIDAIAFHIVLMLAAFLAMLIWSVGSHVYLALIAIVFGVISGICSLFNGVQNAARHRSVVAFHQASESWLRFLTAAGMMLILGAKAGVVLTGYALGELVIVSSQYIFLKKTILTKLGTGESNNLWKSSISRFSWPFAAWGLFTWAQMSSDRWALGIHNSTTEVGLYSAVYQLGYYPITVITTITLQFLGPILFQKAGDAEDKNRNLDASELSWKATRLVLCTTAGLFLLTLLFHKSILRMAVAKKYEIVSPLLPWLLLGGGLFSAGQMISLDLASRLKTRSMVTCKIVTAILGILLNFLGAWKFGMSGVVTACVLFSLTYFVWMAIISRKLVR